MNDTSEKKIISARQLVEDNESVASLPTVFHQLMDLIKDPDSSISDIGQLVSHDQGLSARLLRIVNSAFFGFPRKIETIPHAISILGIGPLHDLALSTMVIDKFKDIPGEAMSMLSFWKHGLACGIAARTIAKYGKLPGAERFFTAGMLHDIGRLVICAQMPNKVVEAIYASSFCDLGLHAAERQVMGFDHTEVGKELLRAWNLPAAHEEAVAYHHSPRQASNSKFRLDASAIHVADYIANLLEPGNGNGAEGVITLDEYARSAIGIEAEHLAGAIKDEVAEQLETAADAFLKTT